MKMPLEIIELVEKKQEQRNADFQAEPEINFSKEQLWDWFQKYYKMCNGKEFLHAGEACVVIQNIKTIFYYFLRDPLFFGCSSIQKDISMPSFTKGLMVIGGYGVGKTSIMRTFESIFSAFPLHRFKLLTTNEVVTKYEGCQNPDDKAFFYKQMTTGKKLFDDFTTEKVASNYGYNDVMREIIEERYHKRQLTHFTLNFAKDYPNDVDHTLMEINTRYGGRVCERLIEMCNVIVFEGKSLRR